MPAQKNGKDAGNVTLTIIGELTDATKFEGSDIVRVVNSGKDHLDENDPSSIQH